MPSTNVQIDFKACGIVPLNRRTVPTTGFCPSKLNNVPVYLPASTSANVCDEDVVSPNETVLLVATEIISVEPVVTQFEPVVVSDNNSFATAVTRVRACYSFRQCLL